MSFKKKIIFAFLVLLATLTIYNLIPEKKLPIGCKIGAILILKSKRQLIVYSSGQVQKIYTISLGKNPIGNKEFEGDKKTPEGTYYICDKNPKSTFYKNLGLSYPNEIDIERSKKFGKPTGGDIKIHGIRNGFGMIGKLHRLFDWTAGCIALTDNEIDELYNAVEVGTKIEIKP